MTRDQVEAILAKLQRWDVTPDFDGGYGVAPCEQGQSGDFVHVDDLREVLEGMIEPQWVGVTCSVIGGAASDYRVMPAKPEVECVYSDALPSGKQ
ncbi:hypothetical protein AB4Y43_01550 [Paraburkholderia sp. BR10872]|uniref:hypothetical protein n=1 Tax=Paraburkholderia sp. BR10872 TaxID=3236989 RepID=UPI0034D24FC6